MAQQDHRSRASPELLPPIIRWIDPSVPNTSAHCTIVHIRFNRFIPDCTSHYRRWQCSPSSKNYPLFASVTSLAPDLTASTAASQTDIQWYIYISQLRQNLRHQKLLWQNSLQHSLLIFGKTNWRWKRWNHSFNTTVRKFSKWKHYQQELHQKQCSLLRANFFTEVSSVSMFHTVGDNHSTVSPHSDAVQVWIIW